MVAEYTSLALNIVNGDGYYNSMSERVYLEAAQASKIAPVSHYVADPDPRKRRPIPYLTPAYSYITGGVWTVSGSRTHAATQVFQVLFDVTPIEEPQGEEYGDCAGRQQVSGPHDEQQRDEVADADEDGQRKHHPWLSHHQSSAH